jgi:hypothetical protein
MKFRFTIQRDEERKHFFVFIALMKKHKLHIRLIRVQENGPEKNCIFNNAYASVSRINLSVVST